MKHLMIVAFLGIAQLAISQKYFSKTGKITFTSDAPMEKITAQNTTASTVIDAGSGAMEWAVLIQGFQFEKALMQEHFNENYMESSRYPKAKFKGSIDNIAAVNFAKDGTYPVTVSGTMEIHGITQPVTAQGTITVKKGAVSAESKLSIKVADYGIQIPKLVADNIAKTVDITVHADYTVMNAIP
ncbi:MAG TPA: YceI family protein [Saprospiraceae bacterium]|nr:YceI family protein [Saprospiraceae bacterium]